MDPRSVRRSYIRKVMLITVVLAVPALLMGVGLAGASAADAGPAPKAGASPAAEEAKAPSHWDLSIGIALAVSLPCLAAGYAVARVGAAALGAASERPELLIRSLIFVALAEGIAIYGLLVAILLYLKY